MSASCSSLSPIEIGTLVTAVCALVVTICQGVVTRKHNRLTVKPVLTLYRKEIDGLIFVRNNGTGPALIVDYQVFLRDRPLTDEQLPALLPSVLDTATLLPGAAIASGETVELFKAETTLDGSHVKPLEELRFRVVYESVYGERRTLE